MVMRTIFSRTSSARSSRFHARLSMMSPKFPHRNVPAGAREAEEVGGEGVERGGDRGDRERAEGIRARDGARVVALSDGRRWGSSADAATAAETRARR